MTNSRKRPVSIKLNLNELYLLGERVIWKINRFSNLKFHAYEDDKTINKKIKSYVNLLDKICNIEDAKPFLNDVTLRFSASEIALIWEVLSKLDGEYELMLDFLGLAEDDLHTLIKNINNCDIFYKDLKYYQQVYIYLYTEFAIAMRDSGNQNVYIDGPLLRVRSTYIYEHLSDYTYIYEFEDIDAPDLNVSFFINEPRYNKIGEGNVKLKKSFKPFEYSFYKVTQKDLHKAQDTLSNSNIDYEYLVNINPSLETYNEGVLYEIECIAKEANTTLLHSDYGPGWRLNLHFYDVFDINGEIVESFDLDNEIKNRLAGIDLIDPTSKIIDEERLSNIISSKMKLINEQKEKLDKLYSRTRYF